MAGGVGRLLGRGAVGWRAGPVDRRPEVPRPGRAGSRALCRVVLQPATAKPPCASESGSQPRPVARFVAPKSEPGAARHARDESGAPALLATPGVFPGSHDVQTAPSGAAVWPGGARYYRAPGHLKSLAVDPAPSDLRLRLKFVPEGAPNVAICGRVYTGKGCTLGPQTFGGGWPASLHYLKTGVGPPEGISLDFISTGVLPSYHEFRQSRHKTVGGCSTIPYG